MDLHKVQNLLEGYYNQTTNTFNKLPGSAIFLRYIRSSYQDDPVRSAIELILVIFFIRYLLAPSYTPHRQNFVSLTEDVGLFYLQI